MCVCWVCWYVLVCLGMMLMVVVWLWLGCGWVCMCSWLLGGWFDVWLLLLRLFGVLLIECSDWFCCLLRCWVLLWWRFWLCCVLVIIVCGCFGVVYWWGCVCVVGGCFIVVWYWLLCVVLMFVLYWFWVGWVFCVLWIGCVVCWCSCVLNWWVVCLLWIVLWVIVWLCCYRVWSVGSGLVGLGCVVCCWLMWMVCWCLCGMWRDVGWVWVNIGELMCKFWIVCGLCGVGCVGIDVFGDICKLCG